MKKLKVGIIQINDWYTWSCEMFFKIRWNKWYSTAWILKHVIGSPISQMNEKTQALYYNILFDTKPKGAYHGIKYW